MNEPASHTLTVTTHQEEDGSLWAEVAELPGCFASGDTFEELWANVAEAVSLYLSDESRTVAVQPGNVQEIEPTERRFLVSTS